ncbi:MAG: arsenate reductase (glutaredoxin), partial [Thiotrichales bacterium]|nr:arsenate reductase (glutaredoxin) [Thiotrichales bacterium]
IIEYLKTPPAEDEIRDILGKLNLSPRDLMRRKEAEYRDNDLDNDNLSDEELIGAMIANPILIERPIVLANNKAAIGRPPESVLEIL